MLGKATNGLSVEVPIGLTPVSVDVSPSPPTIIGNRIARTVAASRKLPGRRPLVGKIGSSRVKAANKLRKILGRSLKPDESIAENETLEIDFGNLPSPSPRTTTNCFTNPELTQKPGNKTIEKIVEISKLCATAAGKSAIPVLEDAGKGSVWQRTGSLTSFIVCTVSVGVLCWFLDKQTKSNPINDGIQGIRISKGPLPIVAVAVDYMFQDNFVGEIKKLLEPAVNDSRKFGTICGELGKSERASLATSLGQLTALNMLGGNQVIFDLANDFLAENKTDSMIEDSGVLDMEKVLCLLRKGFINCSDLMQECRLRDVPHDCGTLFRIRVTGQGLFCVFNHIPYSVLEKKQTLREGLESAEGLNGWNDIDFDKLTFSKVFSGRSVLDNQRFGGEKYGLTFSVMNSPNSDARIKLAVGSPMEIISFRHHVTELEFGKNHLINLDVISEHSSDDIRQLKFGDARNCLFYNERGPGNYKGYTITQCLETKVASARDCSLISDSDAFAFPEKDKPNKALCHPELLKDDYFRYIDESEWFAGINRCPKSCNNLEFRYYPTTSSTTRGKNNSSETLVKVFFQRDEIEARVKTLRRFIAEEVGIILGMLGFCNDITLPKILRFLGTHLAPVVSRLIAWIAKKCVNRNANLTPSDSA